MSIDYIEEKFRRAVETLATHPAPIKERLASAFQGHISSVRVERNVPENLHNEYQQFWERITKAPTEMSEDEAVSIAKLVIQFAHEFHDRLEEERKDSAQP